MKCEEGKRKLSIFETECEPCELAANIAAKKQYKDFNDCTNYNCLPSRVQLSQTINPYCMTGYEVFSSILIGNYKIFLFIFVCLFILMGLATLNRKWKFTQKIFGKKRKDWIDETKSYDKSFVVFAFQGENKPSNQWFLEMDISKDFNSSLIIKQDYLSLARVIIFNEGN